MAQIKQNRQEWEAFIKKTGYIDPVIIEEEAAKKRKIEENIMLAVGTVQDRQNQEYWRERQKEIEEEKKEKEEKARMKAEKKQKRKENAKALIGGLFSGSKKNTQRASSPARRSTGRKAPAEKKLRKPFEGPRDPEREMPDFNPPGWAR